MRSVITLLLLCCSLSLLIVLPATAAQPLSLDQLLQQVRQARSEQEKIDAERIARFEADKAQQQALLTAAQTQLNELEQQTDRLKATFKNNEDRLAEQAAQLKDQAGVLGELSGLVKQVAGDTRAVVNGSLISAQYPGREKPLAAIATNEGLPSIEQFETLWTTLLQEMVEGGKVVRFPDEVISASGETQPVEVVRIGGFNLLADGRYLRYLPETGQLVEFARQPPGRFLDPMDDFADASPGTLAEASVDPTRGVILGMLVKAPGVMERIQQGGAIGYIILLLGLVGLTITLLRMVTLSRIGQGVQRQLESPEKLQTDNPLGRILTAANEHSADSIETLELLVDEAVVRELPPLERGLSLIKLLAAVAPLLGLLGTVTGMIETFQSISLFGTGDPKLMASGISQALMTTMLGLSVAIPLLFLHSLLATRSKGLVQILDEQSAGIVSRLAEQISR